MSINSSTLDKISEIFSNDDININSSDFYLNILKQIYNEICFSVGGIYFSDDSLIANKAFYSEKTNVEADIFSIENSSEFLNYIVSLPEQTFSTPVCNIDYYFKKNFINNFKNYYITLSKLKIRNSFYGFLVIITKLPLDNDKLSIVNLLVTVYSYIIKDYELNKVFKTQLNLLQDTILEKEDAHRIIEKQNKRLLAADKVKSAFLANVSHELRTPLNSIIGFSDALQNQIFGKLNEKQLEYLNDINSSAVHLLGVINSILDFSKIESHSMKLNLSDFKPATAVNEVINLLTPLTSAKEIKILYDNKYDEILNADYQKFQQILFNLIGNAIKFSKEKGKILIRTFKKENKFILEVEDFGIGIEKKYQSFIFKKFTQIDNIYTKTSASTGLGLAVTKEYVKLHKGKVYVVSQLGKGSTFVVELNNK